ncbi:MAG: substrate-binding domain-containing protein [Deltaproteobacteria bacterium]|jgi:molybdate/tungstate transport system substrate-binding protein|nr:substrate-binding domain-containing protein [Deltaproteobacteria bacterium]
MTTTLKIFTAGVAMGVASQTVDQWNAAHPDSLAQLDKGGSVIGAQKQLSGENFDVLILADDSLFSTMLASEVDGYVVFAGNRMVVIATEGRSIDSSDWEDKLTDPQTVFAHFDPKADPGGYRAILSMSLADHYRKGLAQKLLEHPGRLLLDKPGPPGTGPKFDYIFGYGSMAKAKGLIHAQLPEVMDLSQDHLADLYATAHFLIDEKTVIHGSPIAHALAIPKKTARPDLAYEFSKLFLAHDFGALGFCPRAKTVGQWPPKGF